MPTPDSLDRADPDALAPFDMIIDVRSPAEFAEDHVPGAVNLPVLSNEERARVGTLYVQQSPFLARKVGGALVARNVAHHLETALADKPGSFRPLVYCWRGGQRSNAMAVILASVGWRTSLLKGGYKTYRRRVQARLYEQALDLRLVLLDGGTGSAKTELIGRLADLGVQTLDLEGLAGHRGSLFGAFPGRPQPHQKLFESRLLSEIERLDPARPVVVEAESSKIGELMNPPAVWKAMAAAPRIEIAAPRSARAAYLVRAYADIAADDAILLQAIGRLPGNTARDALASLKAMVAAGDHLALADNLMELHYDPAYARSSRKDARPLLDRLDLAGLEEADIDGAAREIAGMIGDMYALKSSKDGAEG